MAASSSVHANSGKRLVRRVCLRSKTIRIHACGGVSRAAPTGSVYDTLTFSSLGLLLSAILGPPTTLLSCPEPPTSPPFPKSSGLVCASNPTTATWCLDSLLVPLLGFTEPQLRKLLLPPPLRLVPLARGWSPTGLLQLPRLTSSPVVAPSPAVAVPLLRRSTPAPKDSNGRLPMVVPAPPATAAAAAAAASVGAAAATGAFEPDDSVDESLVDKALDDRGGVPCGAWVRALFTRSVVVKSATTSTALRPKMSLYR